MKEDEGRLVAGRPEGADTDRVSETGRGSDCDVIRGHMPPSAAVTD